MSESIEVRDLVAVLLNSQRLAVLATIMAGRPYTNLIAFAATPDLQELIFATTRATRKFANLQAEPRVSLLVDSRRQDETDFGAAAALTILGTAMELQGPERQQYQKIFLNKHPYLEGFVTAPTCALLRVRVEKYILVTQFQEVREITPIL